MRQGFDLLTAIGWSNWWQHKFSRWGYVYIPQDTGRHVVCLFRGHVPFTGHIGASVYCQRCYACLEYRADWPKKEKSMKKRFEIYWMNRHWPISAGLSFTVLGFSFLRFAGGGKQLGIAVLGFAVVYNFGNLRAGPFVMQQAVKAGPRVG